MADLPDNSKGNVLEAEKNFKGKKIQTDLKNRQRNSK